MFEEGPADLIVQSTKHIFESENAPWHNDSAATDFFHYFIQRAANLSRFLDPQQDVPTWDNLQGPVRKAYASLFATWLGSNQAHLLKPRSDTSTGSSKGWQVVDEERIFLSLPLFAIAQGILCTYDLVAA